MDYKEIPETIHNVTLSEEQRKRMAEGLPSKTVHDIALEDGRVVNASLTAIKDKEGNIQIGYEETEESIQTPNEIFGHRLSEEQKNLLWEGKNIGPLKYKGQDFFVHIDEQLNKVVVRSSKQMGIPNTVGEYKLDDVDKYYLANGKTTQTRIFKAPDGKYFSAKLGITEKKDGLEILDIKFIKEKNAQNLMDKYNVSSVIKDETRLLYMVGIPANSQNPNSTIESPSVVSTTVKTVNKESNKTIVLKPLSELTNEETSSLTKKRTSSLTKKGTSFSHIKYDSVVSNKDGFTINAKKSFVPLQIKGVRLTEQQRKMMRNKQSIFLKKMKLPSGVFDGTVMLGQNGGVIFGTLKKSKTNKLNQNDLELNA